MELILFSFCFLACSLRNLAAANSRAATARFSDLLTGLAPALESGMACTARVRGVRGPLPISLGLMGVCTLSFWTPFSVSSVK